MTSSAIEAICDFSKSQYPSSFNDTIERRNNFIGWMLSLLPTEDEEIYASYEFVKVRGDGNCFYHAILRYFGLVSWMDLPNKDLVEQNEEETELYQQVLINMKTIHRDYMRDFFGDLTLELDNSCPEYQMGCKIISNTFNIRIIVLEYDSFQPIQLNKLYAFTPPYDDYADTIIMLNLSHHFTLIFPKSLNSKYDTKSIRKIVGDKIIQKATQNHLTI